MCIHHNIMVQMYAILDIIQCIHVTVVKATGMELT